METALKTVRDMRNWFKEGNTGLDVKWTPRKTLAFEALI
jgi:hypothetical protein